MINVDRTIIGASQVRRLSSEEANEIRRKHAQGHSYK
jgi:hypothetical protein